MAYNGVRTYTKPHSNGESSGGTTIINGGSTNNYDTQNLNVININAESANIDNITVRNIKSDNIETSYIKSTNADIDFLNGYTANYITGNINNVNADDINTKNLTVTDTATIENIVNTNLSTKNITTDYLTVNKSAHFFELIVDKIRSVEGTQINTAANCIADYVQAYYNNSPVDLDAVNVDYYRVFWKNKDDDGRAIDNEWLVNDQAICQSFNVHEGTSYDVKNKYYWRLVEQVGANPKYVNLNPDYTGNKKISDSNISAYNIKINSFTFTSGQESYSTFVTEAVNGGYWYVGSKIWEPTETTNALKIYNRSYCFIDGAFTFQTRDTSGALQKTCLNVAVVYDDGTIDYNNASIYTDTYSVNTQADKSVEYFLITTNVIEQWDACNWIDLSNTDYDVDATKGSSIPSTGDNIAQLGYRYGSGASADDIARASAIIIAAYKTPDAGITPPSYAQYQRITDYSLSSHRKTYFDATGAKIYGSFVVDANGNNVDLDQYIRSLQDSNPTKLRVGMLINPTSPSPEFVENDLIVLQTNNNGQITDLNNFPQELVGIVFADNVANITNVTSLNMTIFGRTFDLLNFNGDSAQTGIYVSNVYPNLTSMGIPGFLVQFGYRTGTTQTITPDSVAFSGTYDYNGTTYNFSKNIPIANVSSVEGTDAELYLLDKVAERSYVDNEGTLTTNFKYRINHVIGTTVTPYTPTTEKLKITAYDNTNNIVNGYPVTLTSSDYSTYWEHARTVSDWFNTSSMGGKPFYYTIELLDASDNVLDNSFVNVQLLGTSLFKVEEGLTTSIQANSNAINTANGNITTLQNNYTALTQTVTGINATVSQQQSSISELSSSVSQIDMKADSIDLRVTQTNTNLSNLETGISNTGINITNGTILLQGNKVIFADSNGGHTGNISIDPNTGTLHAVDGDFSGTVNAKGSIGTSNQTYNIMLDSDDTSFRINGAREIKMNPSTQQPIIPYERYSSSTPDFEFFTLIPENWNGSGDKGALDPKIIMKQPYLNSPNTNDCAKIVFGPNGIYFYDIYNGQETLNAVIGPKYIKIPGVATREFSNNAAALSGGLSVGDLYRTGDILKIVH